MDLSSVFVQVRHEEELKEAIETAMGWKRGCLRFIEVIVHKDDTSKELLEWGSGVCSANSRAPNPQQKSSHSSGNNESNSP
ncbi:unnamed protein product [Musa acuminata subsp. malaccensis]|uniref:(wild Malaysian banana) hypothetical protein n=1 Tax=Musa acuminata subsp. malaccensis TaxID=214687 RepID=A0A804JAA7_MUSAM|nr:unnamed protein product [Musa acuminata subsp. malaccensis]